MSIALTEVAGHVLAWCGKTRCWSCCPVGRFRWRTADWSCTVMINDKGKVSKHSRQTRRLFTTFIFFSFFLTVREKYLRLIFSSHTEHQHVLWALSPLRFKLIGHAVSLHFPSPGGVWSKVMIVLHSSRIRKIFSKMLLRKLELLSAFNTQESCFFSKCCFLVFFCILIKQFQISPPEPLCNRSFVFRPR